MPQYPFVVYPGKNPSSVYEPLSVDANGDLIVSPTSTITSNTRATSSDLYITAAAVVKASAGSLMKVSVISATTASALTINDCATTTAASTANEVAVVAAGGLTTGQVLTYEWPCLVGIVVSAVGTGGIFSISYI